MSLNGKYFLGILLTLVLFAGVIFYTSSFLNLIFGTNVDATAKLFYSLVIQWVVLFLIYLYCIIIEKKSILLWKEKKYSILFYLGAIVSLYFICLLGGAILNGIIYLLTHEKPSSKLIEFKSALNSNYLLIIFICLTASIAEELLMRGYIQPRIEKMYNSPFLSVAISSILFGLLHINYGTIGQIIGPIFIGVVFALFYKRYSNIKILIICHFMFDFVSIMVLNFIDYKHLSAFLKL